VGVAPLIRLAPLAADWREGVGAGAADCAVCSGWAAGCGLTTATAGAACGLGADLGFVAAEVTGAEAGGLSSSLTKKLFTLLKSPALSVEEA
jgi:hypothetical protein